MNRHPKRVQSIFLSFAAAIVLAILLLIVNGAVTPTHAQDGQRLNYGENLIGQVAGPEGSLFFFEGKTGDVAVIEVFGVGFPPSIALLDGTRTVVLMVNDNLAGEDTVSLEYAISSDGIYYIQVRSTNTSLGQFAISLQRGQRQLPPGVPLAAGPAVQGTITSGELPVVYDFSTSPDQVSELRVSSFSPGYSPIITVLSAEGETIASLNNPRLLGTTLVLGPGQESLKLVVDLGSYTPPALVEAQLTYGPLAGVSPAGTEEPSGSVELPTLPTSGACVLATLENQNVNVRSGPSTDFAPITTISPQSIYNVIGRNADSSWYLISLPGGGSGWVAASVTRLGGTCNAVPVATSPPNPSAGTPTATLPGGVTATPSATLPGGVTATPSATLPGGVTATPSPTTQAQTAPPDSDYFLNVDMGNSNGAFTQGSVNNVVSYPNGDTEDRVFFSTNNINNQGGSGTLVRQIFTFNCSGTGSEFIEFFTNGQGRNCGDTFIIDAATADSDTGSIRIQATGGSATFVNWTVTMQVERRN